MDASDLPEVLVLEKLCYDFPWSEVGFNKVLDDGLAYVFCSVEGTILGFACFLSVLDEIHLLNICIHPQYQKCQIAQKGLLGLMKYFYAANFVTMFLEVRESNSAIFLYQKLGFQKDGVRKGYYPTALQTERGCSVKEDAVLMSCVLKN